MTSMYYVCVLLSTKNLGQGTAKSNPFYMIK